MDIMYLRLRELREDSDQTQTQLANYLGCRQQTYSRYETGKAQPSLETMERLANYHSTSVDYLMGLTDIRRPYPRSRRKYKRGRL